jgi:hypothetical protein
MNKDFYPVFILLACISLVQTLNSCGRQEDHGVTIEKLDRVIELLEVRNGQKDK